MTTLEKLNDIFRMVFDNDEITVGPQTTANDVEGWDSISHINLILAVEQAFRVRFAKEEIPDFKNVGDLLAAVEAKQTRA